MNTCQACKQEVEAWNERCSGCGYTLELVPDDQKKARYLRGPSLGAALWTQGWTLGARLYLWFILSLIPVVGVVALVACLLFGRRWSWKYGGWSDWETFQQRMTRMDRIGMAWIGLLGLIYLYTQILN